MGGDQLTRHIPAFTLTNEQVVESVKQLPGEQQIEVFRFLLLQQWGNGNLYHNMEQIEPDSLLKNQVITGIQ